MLTNFNYDCIILSIPICISSPLFLIARRIKMCAYKLIEWILRWIPYSVRKKKNTLWHNVALWNVWNLTQLETNNPLEYVWCYVLVIFSSSTKLPYYSCYQKVVVMFCSIQWPKKMILGINIHEIDLNTSFDLTGPKLK